MLSEVGAFRMQNSFANLVNKILQFPINFQNQKIKMKGEFPISELPSDKRIHVSAEYNKFKAKLEIKRFRQYGK